MASETSAFAKVRQRKTCDAIHRVRFLGVAEPYLELWPRAAIHLSSCGKWRSYEL